MGPGIGLRVFKRVESSLAPKAEAVLGGFSVLGLGFKVFRLGFRCTHSIPQEGPRSYIAYT